MTFEPTALPNDRAPLPRAAASTDTENSGIDVPNPTIVSPTTIGEMPSRSARRDAPSTSHDAPTPSITMPAATSPHASGVDIRGMLARGEQRQRQ